MPRDLLIPYVLSALLSSFFNLGGKRGSCRSNTRTLQKKLEIQRDEWAKMYKFQHEIGTLQGEQRHVIFSKVTHKKICVAIALDQSGPDA